MKILKFSLYILFILVLTVSCGEDDPVEPPVDENTIEFEASSFSEAEFITALTDNPSGKTFSFGPGTYNFSNTIPIADLTDFSVIGAGRTETIFDFSNSTSTSGEGIAAIDCSNLLFCGFTVQNTSGGNGITARNIESIRFNDVGTVWPESSPNNGTYGIYPVESDDVIVENCYAQAAIDAGIYSGQNKRVILRNNEMTLNVFGMEVENNIDVEVYGNTFVRNTAGLLVYDLAGVERIVSGSNCKVYDNTFTDNNQTNFAELGSTFAADVPPGIGLLYASTSLLEVTNNTFTDNESASVLGVAYFLVDNEFVPGPENLSFSFYNDNIHLHNNTYSSGGGTYNQAGVLDRPGGPLLEAVYALNGGARPQIILDNQDYTPAGVPFAGTRPVISESNVTIAEASFVGATQGVINLTSTSLDDFSGSGYLANAVTLQSEPSECN